MDQVGKGRPPKHSQFKPGTSGNPSGRPKSRGFLAELLNELSAPIEISGEHRTQTKQRAVVIALVREAMRGDLRAIDTVMRACAFQTDEEGHGDAPEDEAIVKTLTSSSKRRTPKAEDA